MKKCFVKLLSASCAVFLGLAFAPNNASALNISVGVGGEVLPGVYGNVRVDNGRYPALVYSEPLIVSRPSRILEPVYLHVPPGHVKRWERHCGRYSACGRPVYFVKSRDYYDFSPRYVEERYVYRDRVKYVNRAGYERQDYYDRGHDRHDRWERHNDRHRDRKEWREHHHRHGHDHEKRGRGRHDD